MVLESLSQAAQRQARGRAARPRRDFCESTAPWALGYLWTGKREFLDAPLQWHEMIERECMQPHGVPVFDEYWGPTGAFRGTETCDVAATCGRQNLLLTISGQGRLADRIERAFFNAAPATVARDFKTHVYFQSPNRMADQALPAAEHVYVQCRSACPLCCTAALNRFLPNYVINMWMATRDNGLAATCYGPCKVSALVADRVPVEIVCKTDYPFNETIEIAVNPAARSDVPALVPHPRLVQECRIEGERRRREAIARRQWFRASGTVLEAERHDIVFDFRMSPAVATGKDANAGGAPYASVSSRAAACSPCRLPTRRMRTRPTRRRNGSLHSMLKAGCSATTSRSPHGDMPELILVPVFERIHDAGAQAESARCRRRRTQGSSRNTLPWENRCRTVRARQICRPP